MRCSTVSCNVITGSRLPANRSEKHPQNLSSWSPNSTKTDKEIYTRHRATPNPAESVTIPKSAVTFAEIRTYHSRTAFRLYPSVGFQHS